MILFSAYIYYEQLINDKYFFNKELITSRVLSESERNQIKCVCLHFIESVVNVNITSF